MREYILNILEENELQANDIYGSQTAYEIVEGSIMGALDLIEELAELQDLQENN